MDLMRYLPDIEHATLVRAPRAACFALFGSAAGWDRWFTQGMQMDPRPGGAMRFRWAGFGADRIHAEEDGLIEVIEPPARLVFRWQMQRLEGGTRVSLSFSDAPQGTRISVCDQGYPDHDRGRRCWMDCATGWGEALTLARFCAESGPPAG
ncbi:SRPBCC family protein [Pseudomarimonas arenosa]|uniref:SRPBCC domain-containing protein n=1 Tax=Pseudomarimonas arenosa TaxID=2774145 RepID=A0AAW3ZFQ3_9GAMM|nr:SRPBCC domain-containing protein [Pseudomarimonas arenosa]MBD8524315.1 SRPBCC domain-containing protein [Pseudomarimonas arenosa]